MADKFDPYREALVMETTTEWPDDYAGMDAQDKARFEHLMHASPDEAAHLEYVRTHTGFCRHIVVTPEDIERLSE